MTKIKLISALVVTTLAVTPALAAGVTAGNRGPSDISVSRAAPISLPGKATPKPTPHVDPATLSRGFFDMTGEEALAGLATLTLSPGGEVDETPASDALRGILEDEMAGNHGSNG